MSAICGGQHGQIHTLKDMDKHIRDSMDGSCIDCFCEAPMDLNPRARKALQKRVEKYNKKVKK
jgi:hypothetical protein